MSIVPILIATGAINSGRYRCDVCDEKSHASGGKDYIPECPICGSKLCNDCNKYGLCPNHFNKLSVNNKQKVLYLHNNSINKSESNKSLLLIPLVTVFLMIFFAFYFIPPYSKGSGLVGFLVAILIVVSILPIVFISIKNQREKEIYNDQLRNFFEENNLADIGIQENYSKHIIPDKKEIINGSKYCPFCGESHIPEANYCGNCGKRVFNIT